VHGAGPSGALAALALARAGWQVQLCDPLSPAQLSVRSRAYALTHSSRELLEQLQLWQPLQPALAPFQRLELCDRALSRQLTFSSDDLPTAHRTGAAGDAVGWILQHPPLMAVLLQALQAEPAIQLQLGRPVPAAAVLSAADRFDLLVAADGYASPSRRAAGLRRWGFAYRQGCLTVQVRLRGGVPEQAWELFRPEGPFAVLPLGGDAYQLVWSAPLPRLQQLERLDGAAFLDALSAALPEALQAEVLLDQPRAFAVAWELAWPPRARCHSGPSGHRCAGAAVLQPSAAAAAAAPDGTGASGCATAAAAAGARRHDRWSLAPAASLSRMEPRALRARGHGDQQLAPAAAE
jgi:2-octaprenyl-6-methoxyphenol hydroxylase